MARKNIIHFPMTKLLVLINLIWLINTKSLVDFEGTAIFFLSSLKSISVG
ncbi:hypothetical protein LNP12_05070 [Fructobacillus fructosus]|nr:hypothetical protein [Fructobacillus fructosus]MCK8638826.1 hypothetical protein [Fructobacillus fructosus]